MLGKKVPLRERHDMLSDIEKFVLSVLRVFLFLASVRSAYLR